MNNPTKIKKKKYLSIKYLKNNKIKLLELEKIKVEKK